MPIAHPALVNVISTKIPDQAPQIIRDNHPDFITFLQKYYQWLEQEGNAYEIIGNLGNYADIDKTVDSFVEFFEKQFTADIPEAILVDKNWLIKNIREWYRERGSRKSFEFLFRILFNDEIDFRFPSEEILRASDGTWFEQQTIKTLFRTTLTPDLIDEDFTVEPPAWSEAGNVAYTNGEVVATVNGSVEANTEAHLNVTAQAEVWGKCDFVADDGFVISTLDDAFVGPGFYFTTGSLCLTLGLINRSGVLTWRSHHRVDAPADIGTDITSVPFVIGQRYVIRYHWKKATAPGEDDGIAEIWIDGEQVLNLRNLDTDTFSCDRFGVGANSVKVSVVGTLRSDNVEMGAEGVMGITTAMEGRDFIGLKSGAKAIIESVLNTAENAGRMAEITISSVDGTFIAGEIMRGTDADGNVIDFVLEQMLIGATITNPGNNYVVGHPVIFNPSTIGSLTLSAEVSELTTGSIQSTTLVDGGVGFFPGEYITVNNTGVLALADGESTQIKVKSIIAEGPFNNEVSNGGFSIDLTGWNDQSTGGSSTVRTAEGVLEFTELDGVGTASGINFQGMTLIPGVEYVITVDVKKSETGGTGAGLNMRVGEFPGQTQYLHVQKMDVGDNQSFKFTPHVATPAISVFFEVLGLGTVEAEMDNFTVSRNDFNYVGNGNFDADIVQWTDGSTGDAFAQWNAGGYLDLIDFPTGSLAAASFEMGLDPGRKYRLKYDVLKNPAIVRIGATPAASDVLNLTSVPVGKGHEVIFTASTAGDIEQVTNGTFTSDITGWTDSSSGTGSIVWNAAGHMDIIDTAAGDGIADQQLSGLKPNQRYTLTFDVIAGSTGVVSSWIGTSQGGTQLWSPLAAQGIGSHTIDFVPSIATPWLRFNNSGTSTNTTVTIDNISVKAYKSPHHLWFGNDNNTGNAVLNGDFATDLTSWTDADTGTGVSSWVSAVMRLNGGASGSAIRWQTISGLVIGTTYEVKFDVATNLADIAIDGDTFGDGAHVGFQQFQIGTGQTLSFTAIETSATIVFRNNANQNADIDNVSIRELGNDVGIDNISILSSGIITELEIENSGRGYTALPALDGTGVDSGTGSSITLNGLNVGGVKQVAILKPGFGIADAPNMDLSASGDGTAALTPILNHVVEDSGRWLTSDSILDSNRVFQDDLFFQDFSYVIKSGTAFSLWEDLVRKLLHPAGTALFGQVSTSQTVAAPLVSFMMAVFQEFDYQLLPGGESTAELDLTMQLALVMTTFPIFLQSFIGEEHFHNELTNGNFDSQPTPSNLVDEDFDPDPSWTEVGVTGVEGTQMVSDTVAGADAYAYTTFTAENEVWVEAEIIIESVTMPSGGGGLLSLAIADTTNRVDLIWTGSDIEFRSVVRTDAGQTSTTLTGAGTLVVGKAYKIVIRHKRAQTATSNNGVAQVWIDNVMLLDLQNVDNNAETAAEVAVGGIFTVPAVSMKTRTNYVKVGIPEVDGWDLSIIGSDGTASWDPEGRLRFGSTTSTDRGVAEQVITGLTVGAYYSYRFDIIDVGGPVTDKMNTIIGSTALQGDIYGPNSQRNNPTEGRNFDIGSHSESFQALTSTVYVTWALNDVIGTPSEMAIDNIVIERLKTDQEQTLASNWNHWEYMKSLSPGFSVLKWGEADSASWTAGHFSTISALFVDENKFAVSKYSAAPEVQELIFEEYEAVGSPNTTFWNSAATTGARSSEQSIIGSQSFKINGTQTMRSELANGDKVKLAFWFYSSSSGSDGTTDATRLAAIYENASSDGASIFLSHSGGNFFIGAGIGITVANADIGIIKDTWYYVELLVDGGAGTFEMKIDKTSISTGAVTGVTAIDRIEIGHNSNQSANFISYIDETRTYLKY